MSVELKPHTEERIRQLIERGRFSDPATLIEYAVDRLVEQDEVEIEELRAKVLHGFASGDGGEFTPEFWAEIAREADEADRMGIPISPDVQP